MWVIRCFISLAFSACFVFTTTAQPNCTTTYNIINQISTTSYRLHFDSLQTGEGLSRKVIKADIQSPGHDACRDYIYRSMKKYLGNENVSLHTFDIGDHKGLANVIGIKHGTNIEKGAIIISAHYDSNNGRDGTITDCAPGANDNGTGVAALLEIARVIGDFETDYTLIFAAWDFEEQYTNGYPSGSNRWYTDFIKKGRSNNKIPFYEIAANINFDMIGNPGDTIEGKPVLWICSGNSFHRRFVDEYVRIAGSFVPEIKFINKGFMPYSDHYTFAARKIPSVENIESNYKDDPFYHTCSDNLDNEENIDFDFAASVSKGGLAFISEKVLLIKKSGDINVNKLPVPVKRLIDGYAIETGLCTLSIFDFKGNKVPYNIEGELAKFDPPITGFYQIMLLKGDSIGTQRVFLQKKEGHSVSFF